LNYSIIYTKDGRDSRQRWRLNRNPANADDRSGQPHGFCEAEDGMNITRTLLFSLLIAASGGGRRRPAMAQACNRQGTDVSCDDGRRGMFSGDASSGPTAPIEPGLAASERHRRPTSLRSSSARACLSVARARCVVPMEKPERSAPGALPGARWRVVLLLRRFAPLMVRSASASRTMTFESDSQDEEKIRGEPSSL